MTHLSMASAAGMMVVATGVLPSTNVPWWTLAMPAVYVGLAYSSYAGRTSQSAPTWAHPGHDVVEQLSTTHIDPARVFSEAYVGCSGRTTDICDHVYGAKQNDYAGAGARFEPTVCNGFGTRFDGVGVITGAPVGATRPFGAGGQKGYASRNVQAGAFGRYEHVIQDNWGTGLG